MFSELDHILNLTGEFDRLPYRHPRDQPISESNRTSSRILCAQIAGRKHEEIVDVSKYVVAGSELTLPSNARTSESTYYREMAVPAIQPLPDYKMRAIVPRMISTRDLSPDHRVVFGDYHTFNPVQSAAFGIAYGSDENMLICAPTGSGKTNIALLCILREISHFASIEVMKTTPFKIVYVAPMKALASEVVANFKKNLGKLGLVVREFTGDMHLYAEQIQGTDVLVTTPEKWDTVTRRNTGETSLFRAVHLLILDEVHMLNGDRGPVLEAIVARTFRLREGSNLKLRLVGLSATLPNYEEIAQFLHVKVDVGLFYFNWGFRPVPLKQTFVGARFSRVQHCMKTMDEVCYNKLVEFLRNGKQVLIFVHSRANTIEMVEYFEKRAAEVGDYHTFQPIRNSHYNSCLKLFDDVTMRQLRHFFEMGMAVHHAGMMRDDRRLVEELFSKGLIKVLVSTATLAWGVNLPAYSVIIKGTQMYSPSKGCRVNVDLLDVQQMFGRAGRPQYDKCGEAVVITTDKDLPIYLSLLMWQKPIQSQFKNCIPDHLNAEIVLKTVTNIMEAVEWLYCTFFYIRLCKQPVHYGLSSGVVERSCRAWIQQAAMELSESKMVAYNPGMGTLISTEIGRIASHTYIHYKTIKAIICSLSDTMTFKDVLDLLCKAKEFEQSGKIRQNEQRELTLLQEKWSRHKCSLTAANTLNYKVSILIQAFFSHAEIAATALHLDQVFFVQNAKRILRAVFEIILDVGIASAASTILDFRKSLEHKMWPTDHPIYQMKGIDTGSKELISETGFSLYKLKSLPVKQLYKILRQKKKATMRIKEWLQCLPLIGVAVTCYRLTPDLIRLELHITPNFRWNWDVNHDTIEPFIMWVENPAKNKLLVFDNFVIHNKQVERNEKISVEVNMMHSTSTSSKDDLLLFVQSEHWLGIKADYKISHEMFSESDAFIPLFRTVDDDVSSEATTDPYEDCLSSGSDDDN